jgi:hypothetical protein
MRISAVAAVAVVAGRAAVLVATADFRLIPQMPFPVAKGAAQVNRVRQVANRRLRPR